jgi:hypothetical protein
MSETDAFEFFGPIDSDPQSRLGLEAPADLEQPFDELEQISLADNFVVEGYPESGGEGYPKCPAPSRWKVASSRLVKGRAKAVSNVYGPSQIPTRIQLCSQWTHTFGTEVSGTYGWDLKVIEAQVGVKLSASISVQRNECISFSLPKGVAVFLAAAPIYALREITRTVYGSAMCNRVDQKIVVHTPTQKALMVLKR